MGFNGKTVWRFQTKKKNKNIIPELLKNPSGTPGPYSHQLNITLVYSKNYTKKNLKEGLHIKTVGTLQDKS